jgi:hypothetical protein
MFLSLDSKISHNIVNPRKKKIKPEVKAIASFYSQFFNEPFQEKRTEIIAFNGKKILQERLYSYFNFSFKEQEEV